MNKKDFAKVESFTLAMEAVERKNLDLAKTFLENANSSERALLSISSGMDVKSIIDILKKEIESSVSIGAMAEIYLNSDVSPEAREMRANMFKHFFNENGSHGVFSLRANSPMIVPAYNQRLLTETSGSTLIGTNTRNDLTELPNLIPVLQKLGVTFNIIEGIAFKQSIPMITTNAPVADVLNGVIVGSLDDAEFDVCPGNVWLLTSQLPISRRFFIQASDTANELLKQMMFNAIFDALLYRVFYGEEASGQCEGLTSNAAVLKVVSTSFDEAKGYELMRMVHANSAPEENCIWVINAATEKLLKARAYTSGGDRRIIEKGLLLDKPYVLSERVAAGQVWYGAFQSIVLTLFNVEILFDQYTADNAGTILIKTWQNYSMDVRHPGWIVCGTNVD